MNQTLTIYRASAGSGKTFALAVEYIMSLLQNEADDAFTEILAVTFTNKATAEMKGRILETLYGLKEELDETKDYLKEIKKRFAESGKSISDQEIRDKAGKALTAILHDYSHFRVETIDSFFQSILRNMARELGLAANLQVELSTDEIIDSAVDSLIETMSKNAEVEKWVREYVEERLSDGEKWDIVNPLKAFAKNIFKEDYQQKSEDELAKISNQDIVKAFKNEMFRIRQTTEQQVTKNAVLLSQDLQDGPLYEKISSVNNVINYLGRLAAKDFEMPTKAMEEKINGEKTFLKTKYQADTNSLAEENELRERILQILNHLKNYFSARCVLKNLNELRLLRNIDELAHKIEGETGRFILSSTPVLLSKMSEGNDAPFIFEKIGTAINNVMIDEFQDTSLMQWENFKKLLLEKLASGGKVMLVGDIKQSIYRWRNGDWKILHNIKQEMQGFDIKDDPLDINYRSHQFIVDFNNAFFPLAAQQLDNRNPDATIKLANIYHDVEQKKKKDDGEGYVRIKLYKNKEEDNTIDDMVEQIKRLQARGLELSKIAILIRENKNAQKLINGFSQHGIPIVSDEAFRLEASVSVQMIVAAMRLLVDKLHTDIISEKYLMLHYLRDVLGQEDTTIQSVALQEAEQVLPKDFTEGKEKLLQIPLYLLAEKLWLIFSLDKITGEDPYVLAFFDALQKHLSSAAAPDIQTFLEAWDDTIHKSSIPGCSMTGIRILTIHKAKGLAFHTVMLPFNNWAVDNDQTDEILWCKTDVPPYNEMGALPISIKSKGVRTSVFAPCYEKEHMEKQVDTLNLQYVAFTRAEANLYVYGVRDTNRYNVAKLIYDSLRNDSNDPDENCFTYEIGSPVTEAKEEDEKKNPLALQHLEKDAIDVNVVTRDPKLYFMQSNQAQDYLRQQTSDDGQQMEGIRLSQREIGTRMHEVLSRVGDVSQLEEVFNQARQEGLIGDSEDWNAITTRITEGFRDPIVASWFKADNIIYNECSIAGINKEGQPDVLRPDRVVMNNGCITVVDYKFGHPSKYYDQQVKAYMEFMQCMYPQHEIKGYLWYVMGKGAVPIPFKTKN